MKVGKLFTDGASRGNPGEAGIGCVIYNKATNEALLEESQYIGQATNNVAEYKALLVGLEAAIKLGLEQLEVYADSELMIKQMKGIYQVKNPGLQPLFREAKKLVGELKSVTFQHVPRNENKKADELANLGIDQKKSSISIGSEVSKTEMKKGKNFPNSLARFGPVGEVIKVTEGIYRQNTTVGSKVMQMKAYLEKGAVLPTHMHPHEQISFVLEGKVSFSYRGKAHVLVSGESVVFAPNEEHGAEALEDSVVLDTFSPLREDYL